MSGAVSSTVNVNTKGWQWDFNLDDDVLVKDHDETISITIPAGSTISNSYTYNSQGEGNNSDYTEQVSLSTVKHYWSGDSQYQIGTRQWF